MHFLVFGSLSNRTGSEKIRRPQCNAFYHISAYKSMYGQDSTIVSAILVPWTQVELQAESKSVV